MNRLLNTQAPSYLRHVILPPTPYTYSEVMQEVCRVCTKIGADAYRCILCDFPPYPVLACALGLYLILLYLYYNTVILIVKCIQQSQTPVRTSA